MNLGILFGGNSLEHEISIVSAYGLSKRLSPFYQITMIYMDHQHNIFQSNRLSLSDYKENNLKKLKKTRFVFKGIKNKKIDCMLLCMHGENGEDGIASALCRYYKIPFVGSEILASSICIDKNASYRYLAKNGVPMVKTQSYTYQDYIKGKRIKEYPCIIKPVYGGSSIGIYVCKDEGEFEQNIVHAFEYGKEFIIQPYFETLEEFNLAIYEKGFSKLERIDKKDEIFSFNNKYNESFKLMHQTLEENELYESIKKIGRKAYELLRCSGIIRIDFFVIEGKVYLNEVNILPGALAMYLFDDFISVIESCIEVAMQKKEIVYKKGSFLSKTTIEK